MWVPYRNLFFLAILSVRRANGVLMESDIIEKAVYQATKIASSGYPGLDIVETDSGIGDNIWPEVSSSEANKYHQVKFSRALEAFIMRGRRGSRESVDRLILAYTALGISPEDVYRETFGDYSSIRGVTKIQLGDLINYGTFFWNFAPILNIQEGVEWLNNHGMETEASILSGETSLDDVRALMGVERGLDFLRRLKTLTYKNSRVVERILDEMLKMDDMGVDAYERNKTEYMKNAAAYIASSIAFMKLYQDSMRGDTGDQTLGDIIEIRMREAKEEELKAQTIPDWAKLQDDDLSPADLLAENQALNEENDISADEPN